MTGPMGVCTAGACPEPPQECEGVGTHRWCYPPPPPPRVGLVPLVVVRARAEYLTLAVVIIHSSGAKESADSDGSQKEGSALLADWEVIDSEGTSKKPPPAVREKPKNKQTVTDSSRKDAIEKKFPILPPSKIASLANVFEKGQVKVGHHKAPARFP